MSSTPPRR